MARDSSSQVDIHMSYSSFVKSPRQLSIRVAAKLYNKPSKHFETKAWAHLALLSDKKEEIGSYWELFLSSNRPDKAHDWPSN